MQCMDKSTLCIDTDKAYNSGYLNQATLRGPDMLPSVVAKAGFFALWHPEVMVLVIILGFTYRQLVGPLRSRFGPNLPPFPRMRQWAMYLSLVTLYIAVGTPLQILADQFLLTAHMIQFVLLAMVLPPLFLIGLPDWLIAPVLHPHGVMAAIKFFTRPGVALLVFTVVFSIFQVPNLLEATLKYNGLYLVEEYLMMLASIFLWWPVYSPTKAIPSIARPLTLLYLFAMSLPTLLTFAFITLAGQAFYSTYITGAHALGVSPLTDQQLGGAVMKVSTMLILLVVFIKEFYMWVQAERAKEAAISIPNRQARNPNYRPPHLTMIKGKKRDSGT